jgi:D-alanyl-D-alanine carboxypeptidase
MRSIVPCLRSPRPSRVGVHLFGLVLVLAFAAVSAARADEVDDLLAAEVRKGHLPGVSVAILREGEPLRTAAAGLADLELAVPVDPATVFQIQSITKTFTAAAIQILADEGRLGLDDPVAKHLPGTPDSWKSITLRHLLTHTSGIKDFINSPTASLRLDVTEEEVLRATAERPVDFAPGERYAYSNTNYHLLAMVIRKLTGQAYGEFLRDRIFLPLGMTHTRVLSLTAVIPGRASGYHWTGAGFRQGDFVAESILSYGGGGVLSTAPDLALWARVMLRKGGGILKPEAVAAAWTRMRLADGKESGYGLGWGLGEVEGHREVSHTGGHVTGFSTCLSIYPDDRLAVVVLVNRTGANPARIARRLAGLYVPALAPRPPAPIEDREPETAALVRDCLGRVSDWRLERNLFTPEMWQVLESERESIQAQARMLGAPGAIELLARSTSPGLRTSRFRVRFAGGAVFVMSVVLDADGRITGWQTSEEE